MVTVSEAYFDESYEDRSPRILCVAGYVYRKSRSREFAREWSAYLRKKGLPYFHANECAHTQGVFKGRDDTDAVSRKLIALTKEKTDLAVAVAVDQDAYDAVFPRGSTLMPSAYAFALMNCCYQIAHWRGELGYTSSTAFFFEQGHQHADDAHRYLRFLLRSDDFGQRIGYRSHAFVPKETPQVQPADLLAWLARLDAKRVATGDPRKRRGDFLALQRPKDRFSFFGLEELKRFRSKVRLEWDDANEIMRQVARDAGLPEEDVEEVVRYRPDYRTTKF